MRTSPGTPRLGARRRAQGWLAAELSNPRAPAIPMPPVPVAPEGDRARLEQAQGEAALRAGRLAVALNHFTVAQSFARGDALLLAEALAGIGQARLRQDNIAAAQDAFRQALQANPAHVEARVGLAELAVRGRFPHDAIELLYEALPLIPEPARRAGIHLRLAAAHRRLASPQLARPHLRAALHLGPPPGTRGRALLHFALSLDGWQWLALLLAIGVGVLSVVGMGASAAIVPLLVVALFTLFVVWNWVRLDR